MCLLFWKGGHGIFNARNYIRARSAHEDETSTDESAQVLTRKMEKRSFTLSRPGVEHWPVDLQIMLGHRKHMYHFSIAVGRVPLVTLFCGLHNAFILRHCTFLTSASNTRSCKASNGYVQYKRAASGAVRKEKKRHAPTRPSSNYIPRVLSVRRTFAVRPVNNIHSRFISTTTTKSKNAPPG